MKSFWDKVVKSEGCWAWSGYKQHKGYGRIRVGGKVDGAHRVSYEIHYGPIPKGLWILHSCDNPECTNPEHLRLGNHQDNMNDMNSRRRGNVPLVPGTKNGMSKLSDDKVMEIRAHPGPLRVIAKDYGINISTASRIRRRETWKHL